MPRTKYPRNSKLQDKENINKKAIKQELVEKSPENIATIWLTELETEMKIEMLKMKKELNITLETIDTIVADEFTLLDPSKAEKTLGELRREKSFALSSTVISDVTSILKNNTIFKSFNNTVNNNNTISKSRTAAKNKKHTDDEGYLTAGESGRSASSDRASRSRSRSIAQKDKTFSNKRVSRSLSRSRLQKTVVIQAPEKKTPEKRLIPPNNFGFVTPKVKPNTPLSILRRPKQGEMAISMQGSPLLVSGVITETCANVNIPLQDGRILSLQPSKTLRMSEIPHLDDDTRQQLLALRDNLNKVVKSTNDR